MISEPTITIQGNLAGDPELRYVPSGTACASFTVAANPRVRDAEGNWGDGPPVFLRCTAWRELAEHAAASLRRGDPVLVVGRFRQREYQTDAGEKRRADDIQADTVAVPLDKREVRLIKVTRETPAAAGPAAGTTGGGSDS
jgi:single-strand DNA-binding protein